MAELVRIRECVAADVEGMFRLDEICFDRRFRFDRGSMRAFAMARDAVSLIAEDAGGGLMGLVIVHVEWRLKQRYGYVVTLDVAPEFRQLGVAGQLMDEAERRVRLAGGTSMELHVFTGNAAAVGLYERRGYVRVGMKAGFYGQGVDGVGLDAWVYRKEPLSM